MRSPRSAGSSPVAGVAASRKGYPLLPGPGGGSGLAALHTGTYMASNSIGSHLSLGSRTNQRVVWSPHVNAPDLLLAANTASWGRGNTGSYGRSGAGPESLAVAQKRPKSESVRRKHMRQHSAQLYMEDVKGVVQIPRCRDVLFLLLFFFHLMGVVYLGNRYSAEAFQVHTIQEQERHSTLTVYYTPLLYLSCISGAFAVVLSSLLLGAMSIFPRNFVQVALVVVITLSFVWGTVGIGLSPRNVVPVTGIIALALSVAYAFIVWDRIPFAAANLTTALSAIRTHPGLVLVAVASQILALGWSIYYCIVVVGVYDSIRVGKLAVHHRVAVLIYVLLGMSFYWTYQVLLVRCH